MQKYVVTVAGAALLFLAGVALAQTQSPRAQTQQIPAQALKLPLPRVAIVRAFTTDLDRGDRFYRNVFGLQDGRGSHSRERVFSFGDSERPVLIVALSDTPPANHPLPGFSIVVSDMNSVLQRVVQYGGSVYLPPRVLSAGELMAFVRDPDGNQVEILQMPRANKEQPK